MSLLPRDPRGKTAGAEFARPWPGLLSYRPDRNSARGALACDRDAMLGRTLQLRRSRTDVTPGTSSYERPSASKELQTRRRRKVRDGARHVADSAVPRPREVANHLRFNQSIPIRLENKFPVMSRFHAARPYIYSGLEFHRDVIDTQMTISPSKCFFGNELQRGTNSVRR